MNYDWSYLNFFAPIVEFKLLYVCLLFFKTNDLCHFNVQFEVIIKHQFETKKIAKLLAKRNEFIFVSSNFGVSLFPLLVSANDNGKVNWL